MLLKRSDAMHSITDSLLSPKQQSSGNSDGRVIRASASEAVDSGQTNDLKIGIRSFPD